MKEKYKVGFLLLAIIIFVFLGNLYYNYLGILPQNYTVGTVIKIVKPAKGNLDVHYYYFVDSIRHRQFLSLGDYQVKEGEKYLVKFPIGYEGEGRILLDEPINKNVTVPRKGWTKKPNLN